MYSPFEDIEQLFQAYQDREIDTILLKFLAANDNSKNQIYMGGKFEALTFFPNLVITPDKKSVTDNPIFKAPLNFSWLVPSGETGSAPNAQLIYYPQYPEVRLSGFLKGVRKSIRPSEVMTSRTPNRILLIGIKENGELLGHILSADSPLRGEIESMVSRNDGTTLYFLRFDIQQHLISDIKSRFLQDVRNIHQKGWIDSKKYKKGTNQKVPCNATNCGGVTIETELNIPPNSKSEPDHLGWELKTHGVKDLSKPIISQAITLMTPAPTHGYYISEGVINFIKKFGYLAKDETPDRMNFGGVHRFNRTHSNTNLTLKFEGFTAGNITDANGALCLVDVNSNIAAAWSFSGLMTHWNKKHNQAAFIPSVRQNSPIRQYMYGNLIRLGEGTDFMKFLHAIENNKVYYDPGIKVENISSKKPKSKARNQIRINSKDVGV
jgi:hypothetical protein